MSFLCSLFLGTPGSYNILGQQVVFVEKSNSVPANEIPANDHSCSMNRIASTTKRIYNIVIHAYLNTFFHESGHAFVHKFFGGKNPKIVVYNDGCGKTEFELNPPYESSKLKNTIQYIAGSFFSIACETCKYISVMAFNNYLRSPIFNSLHLLAAMQLASHATNELFYCFMPSREGNSDVELILRDSGFRHTMISIAVIMSEYFLSINILIMGLMSFMKSPTEYLYQYGAINPSQCDDLIKRFNLYNSNSNDTFSCVNTAANIGNCTLRCIFEKNN